MFCLETQQRVCRRSASFRLQTQQSLGFCGERWFSAAYSARNPGEYEAEPGRSLFKMFFRGAVVMSHAYDWVGAERCWELKFQAVGRTSAVKFINEMYVRHYAPEGETASHLESSRKRSAYLTPVDLEDQLGAPLFGYIKARRLYILLTPISRALTTSDPPIIHPWWLTRRGPQQANIQLNCASKSPL